MTAILLFIVLIIGLNCIPLLTKTNFPKMEKMISKLVAITAVAFLFLTVLLFNGYKLKGLYSNSVVGIAFILTTLLYFALVKNSRRKIWTVFIVAPLILLSLFTLLFDQTINEYKITDKHKITVSTGGLLACGEIINITETDFGIFDKEIYDETNLCLRGINNIETKKFSKDIAEFLIYHNGELDSENPYRYEIKNKNVW